MIKTAVPEMWGMTEICEHVGLSRARIHQLRDAGEFPVEHQTLRCGPIWQADIIRKWVGEYKIILDKRAEARKKK